MSRHREQAVVTARVRTRNGGAGKATQPVGLQPFATKRFVEISADFFFESNHEFLQRRDFVIYLARLPSLFPADHLHYPQHSRHTIAQHD